MGWLSVPEGHGLVKKGKYTNTQIHKNTKYTKWAEIGTNWGGLLCYRVFETDNLITKDLGRKCFDLF